MINNRTIQIGKYIIEPIDNNIVFLSIYKDGEGMGVNIKDLERIIDDFYNKNF